MKRLILFLTGFSVATFTLLAQEADSLDMRTDDQNYHVRELDEVEIITDEVVKKGQPDTTSFILGKKEVKIIEEDGETSVKIKDLDDDELSSDENKHQKKWWEDIEEEEHDDGKFKGHWSAFEFGLNNLVNDEFSLSRTPENEFMDINTGKSWNFNLNFAQYSFPIISDRFGLVTGMGIEWSNYHFANNTTIVKSNGVIQPDTLSFDPRKNKLTTTYITVPLLLETQIFQGGRNDRLYIAAGVIGGVKITSKTKVKDSNNKNVERGDFYLRPFRAAVTGRIGYKMVKLYCNYYLTSLFLDDKGPELYPIAAGLSLTF